VSDHLKIGIDELFKILTKGELIRRFKLPSCYGSWRKAELGRSAQGAPVALGFGGLHPSRWSCFNDKWGIQPRSCAGIIWTSRVALSAGVLPTEHLRAWFEWILRDVKENRAGFPDLVQFYPGQSTGWT
jgi:hypothetical protein